MYCERIINPLQICVELRRSTRYSECEHKYSLYKILYVKENILFFFQKGNNDESHKYI